MRLYTLLAVALVTVAACGPSSADAPAEVAAGAEAADSAVAVGDSEVYSAQAIEDVESAIRQFYTDVNAFDHEGIRRRTTADFEFLDGGRRMDGDAFETFMRGIESGGIALGFELSELNTEVEGEVAYTSFLATTPSSVYVEAGVLRRSEGRWVVDRLISAGVVPE